MSKFKGKKVLIVGCGSSGVASAKFLVKQGARVMITDMKQRTELAEPLKVLGDLKVEFEFGGHTERSFMGAEMIIVSPGVNVAHHQLLQAVKTKGTHVTSEIELAVGELEQPLIAITSTNGKSTVTTLIGELFKSDQKPAFIGGNLGTPLIEYVTEGQAGQVAVCELSSAQLELTEKMVPAVAVFTNIDQDHLDRYGSMENYINAKKRLLKVCDRNSWVVLNHDDDVVRGFANECNGKIVWFTMEDPIKKGGEFAEKFFGAYFDAAKNAIVTKLTGKDEVYTLEQFKLFGDHNKQNLMASICAARVMGVSQQAIQNGINQFKGLPHRLEYVRKKDGVYFFNDSKATNIQSVQASLNAFKRSPIILIAGGKDKNMDFAPLAQIVHSKVKLLILVGEAKEKINRALGDFAETYLVGTFEEAVLMSFQKSRNGDIILLSPGCSSQDMFRDFEERGEYFKKLVNQL
jgi:UDP-N-acetylmuramoylalanine--D-glutamate ligase